MARQQRFRLIGVLLAVITALSLNGPAGLLPAGGGLGSVDAAEVVAEVLPGPVTAAPPADESDDLPPAGVSGSATLVRGAINSRILGESKPYLVYLPPGYEGGARSYPVLYMLHGMGGDFTEWQDQGLFRDAEHLMSTGQIPPFIIVTPQGDKSYWINWANGGLQYANYVLREVVPHIDASYRTRPTPGARAVGGLSMGGTGALALAYNNPDVFGIVGGHAPTLRTAENALEFQGTGQFFESQDPVSLARTAPGAAQVRTWLDVGAHDEWRWRVEELSQALTDRGIDHVYRVLDGNHEREYWEAWGALYLRFYGEAFLKAR